MKVSILHASLVVTAVAAVIALTSGEPELPSNVAYAANGHECMQIQNEDRRNLCLGRATRNLSACGMIRDLDMRNLCMAQIQKNRSICGMIKDLDMRAECNASM